jgi:hypothetical protein|tara:strand:- start:1995 stop:2354 length:360 start_codon:yes stop_codon:yes gene_type:complete
MANQYDWGDSGSFASFAGDLLEANPAAAYYSYGEEWNTPMQQRHYQNQFQNIYNQYLGSLGGLLREDVGGGSVIPSVTDNTFTGFLGNYDWNDRYGSLPPQMRGSFESQYNPRTREIYF